MDYPQPEGCPDHPGPVQHWSERGESCWECDIRFVYPGSRLYEEWLEGLGDPQLSLFDSEPV